MAASNTSNLQCSLQLSLDGQQLVVHRSQDHQDPPRTHGSRTIPPAASNAGGSSGSRSSGSGTSQALASLAQYLGIAPAGIQLESIEYRRARLPAAADREAVEGEPPGMALLRRCQVGCCLWCEESRRGTLPAGTAHVAYKQAPHPYPHTISHPYRHLQGLYTGSYGPHGQEVLQLTASAGEGDVPPLCPITGPRLQAFKLLGDPNVPALRWVMGGAG